MILKYSTNQADQNLNLCAFVATNTSEIANKYNGTLIVADRKFVKIIYFVRYIIFIMSLKTLSRD